jgi:hypothetical protein
MDKIYWMQWRLIVISFILLIKLSASCLDNLKQITHRRFCIRDRFNDEALQYWTKEDVKSLIANLFLKKHDFKHRTAMEWIYVDEFWILNFELWTLNSIRWCMWDRSMFSHETDAKKRILWDNHKQWE